MLNEEEVKIEENDIAGEPSISSLTSKKTKSKKSGKYVAGKVIANIILVITAIVFVLPFMIAVSVSFTDKDLFNEGFKWIPNPIVLDNYVYFFTYNNEGINVFKAFLNTMLYISPPILVGVLASALAAYAFARIEFKGKNIVFYLLLATMVIPGIITLTPAYVLFTNFYHWTGTALPLIIPGMFGSAMTMFFLNQYFKTLPKDLEEAAQIDGMGKIGIFFKIILPLSAPAIITQVILSFNGCYNDYLGPLLYLGSYPSKFTVQLLVQSFQGEASRTTPYTQMMAAAITTLLPTLALYIGCQKYFVEGIAMTGLK